MLKYKLWYQPFLSPLVYTKHVELDIAGLMRPVSHQELLAQHLRSMLSISSSTKLPKCSRQDLDQTVWSAPVEEILRTPILVALSRSKKLLEKKTNRAPLLHAKQGGRQQVWRLHLERPPTPESHAPNALPLPGGQLCQAKEHDARRMQVSPGQIDAQRARVLLAQGIYRLQAIMAIAIRSKSLLLTIYYRSWFVDGDSSLVYKQPRSQRVGFARFTDVVHITRWIAAAITV